MNVSYHTQPSNIIILIFNYFSSLIEMKVRKTYFPSVSESNNLRIVINGNSHSFLVLGKILGSGKLESFCLL
jgi:hypothetical protein